MIAAPAPGLRGLLSRLREQHDALLLGAGFLILYTATAATTVQGGDAGEFMVLGAGGGVAHPPGYPLYVLLCRLLCLLPVGSVALRASLASALLAAASLALLQRAIQLLGGSRRAAALAAAALGISPLFWRYATVAEVFAGASFTGALALWAVARVEQGQRGPRAAAWLGLALASGVAHHHTAILLLPLLLYGLWRARQGTLLDRRNVSLLGSFALISLGGLLPYLTLLAAGGLWRWGDTSSPGGLLDHFLRRDFGTFALGSAHAEIAWWQHPWAYLASLPADHLIVVPALALLGAWRLLRDPARRLLGLSLLTAFALCGPMLMSRFELGVQGLDLVVASRFRLLPGTLLAAAAGLGLSWLFELGPRLRLREARLAPVLVLGLIAGALIYAPRARHDDWTVLEDYARNALQAMAPGAILVGSSDSELGAFLYLQQALGERRDVAHVAPPLLGQAWYRAWLERQDPALQLPDTVDRAALIARNLSLRPIYLSSDAWSDAALRARFALVPTGAVLLRVLGPASAGVSIEPATVEAEMTASLERLLLRSLPRSDSQLHDTWEGDSYLSYARSFAALADLYAARGDGEGQRRCGWRARRLARPWIAAAGAP